MSRYRTIVLDLDGTLIDERHGVAAGFTAAADHAAHRAGIDAGAFQTVARAAAQQIWWQPDWLGPLTKTFGLSAWDALSETYEGCVPAVQRVKAWLPAYRRAVWSTSLAHFAVTDPHLADELTQEFIAARHGCPVPLLPGALEVLTAFSDRCLAVLTNGPADGQRRKLAASGVLERTSFVIISTEIGVGKPDPRAMKAVLDRSGSSPTNTIMVGDTYERDVLAAVNTGMPAIWISGAAHHDTLMRGIAQVQTTADVAAALRRLEAGDHAATRSRKP